ncbi:MAG TPA: hybrid sensor histidine kinase/response regulator [bacterium]|nr:hybrid sensor histidine kinase/response regulator [bacterium]
MEEYRIKKIFVVDDEKEILNSIFRAFKFSDYNLILFTSAEEALKALTENENDYPDLIITDYRLLGMTGLDFLSVVKTLPHYISVLIITGYGDSDLEIRSYRIGAEDFIYKPVTFDKLMESIKKIDDKRKKQYQGFQTKIDELNEFFQAKLKMKTEQLIRVDRLAHSGLINAKLIHEMNNFLTQVKLSVDIQYLTINNVEKILREKKDSSELVADIMNKIQKYNAIYEHICASMKDYNDLITNSKTFFQMLEGDLQTLNIQEFIEEVLKIIGIFTGGSVLIETSVKPLDIKFNSDKKKLRQIFLNLIHNSLSALKNQKKPKINIQIYKENAFLIVKIRDNGCGIDKNIIQSIWEPYFTTKDNASGSGLGLSIVKDLVDALSGTIKVESNSGTGTCFIIELPELDLKEQKKNV